LFFPGHDRRHNLNVVASWRLGRYMLGGRFGYSTGTPYTPVVGEIVRRSWDPTRNTWHKNQAGQNIEALGGPRNSARMPRTQRLDLNLSREFNTRGATITPYLSVVNAYNAKNVFVYFFDYSIRPPVRTAVSQFPFLPSVGVTVAF
jgi:hypothetical protein